MVTQNSIENSKNTHQRVQYIWRKWLSMLRPRTPSRKSFLVLERRRIFIVPTRQGLLFALILFVMLLGSINYNNSMGYMLTFLLAGMVMVSILHTHRMLLGLRIETGKTEPVFAGEIAQFQLWLDNRGQPARHALVWQYEAQIPPTLGQLDTASKLKRDIAELTIDVAADQRESLILPVLAARRGQAMLGQIMVYSQFPLGLFHAWSYVHLDAATIVYPAPFGHKTLPSGKNVEDEGEGSLQVGSGEDFIGYRNYQVGDSPRHIDWKAVAREQSWLIKQFGGVSGTTLWLTWEDVSTFNHLEAALSQLCLWILVADQQGAQYGLKIPGYTFEPHLGEQHREHCLQALALFVFD